ncbi:MAG TPA: LCP family protein [Armatimonadota bacterium]|nr:LCP family protein [Armatimonadota bacterium]
MQYQHSQRRVRRRSKVWLWIIVVIAGIIAGVIGGLAYRFFSITNTTPLDFVQKPFGGQRIIRILALGEDNTHKSSKTGRGLSDTIMVAAVDLDAKTVRAISIPRDTRVEVAGHGIEKINTCYSIGGPELAIEAAQAVLGVPVDYYIKTDISGLKEIVDLVGGVGIEVEKNMYYRDRRGGLYINLKKGYRHLNGDQALQYVRYRRDVMGDITRIQRQQKFLRALARHSLQKENWAKLPSIATEIYENKYVETNMNLKDIKALVELARDIPPDQMEMETVPGTPQTISGVSYWIPDLEKTAELVDMLLEPSSTHTAKTPNAKVEVLNGSGISGVAKEVADQLEKYGYVITNTGNASRFNYDSSQIIVHNGKVDGADRLAQLIGCTKIRTLDASAGSHDGPDITVIVGKDYRQN